MAAEVPKYAQLRDAALQVSRGFLLPKRKEALSASYIQDSSQFRSVTTSDKKSLMF
jgi:hypothetical protein